MNNIDFIVNKVKSIYTFSDENISALKEILQEIEENKIKNRLHIIKKANNEETLKIKSMLLNSVIELLLENPSLDNIAEEEKKHILMGLFSVNSSIYEELVISSSDTPIKLIDSVVIYCILSYCADKQTISNFIIEDYNNKLNNNKNNFDNLSIVENLEFQTFYLIVLILSNLKNYGGLSNLNRTIDRTKSILEKAQIEELAKPEIDVAVGIRISAYANIIFLVDILKEYLFTGYVSVDGNEDIYSLIDNYSYNVLYLLGDDLVEIKFISHLLKYAFSQVVRNSIWNIADKSPNIRKFIEKNRDNCDSFIYSLLPSQRDVISDVLVPKKSIVLSMPTSAGKSLLAEMQILFSLHNYKSDNFRPTVCYVVPTNALTNQVKNDLNKDFKMFDFNIVSAMPYYEIDEIEDEMLIAEHIDILISTPEKLESLVRSRHKSIENLRLVIVDEAHNIGDAFRGSKFELLLAAIKQTFAEANFLLLSPFITNAKDINDWLDSSSHNSTALSVEWSPTNQYVGCNILKSNKTISTIEFYPTSRNLTLTKMLTVNLQLNPQDVKDSLGKSNVDYCVKECTLAHDLVSDDGTILILCGGSTTLKRLACSLKQFLAEKNKLEYIGDVDKIKNAISIVALEMGSNCTLIECLQYGIGYHYSGLSNLVKETIEELAKDGVLKLLVTTTTLAQGMNFPINTVIFDTLKFKGKNGRPMTSAEFWNIAGRAGRTYKDKDGYIITPYCNSAKNTRKLVNNHIKSELDSIISSLIPFFENSDKIEFSYDYIKDPSRQPILNLLQYINHIVNVRYNYDLISEDTLKIRSILTDSYLYNTLNKKKGYVQSQFKLNNFVGRYIEHIKKEKISELKKSDQLGISDISYTKIKEIINASMKQHIEDGEDKVLASKVILENKNVDKLAEIIFIISNIPEIKIFMIGKGRLDAESIARLLIGWVHGKRVYEIANEIKRDGVGLDTTIELCNKYINTNMRSYMPWGINIYQQISYDNNSANAKMLPSYIYYGVSTKEDVILSKIGVPRFALESVKKSLNNKNKDLEINIDNMKKLKNVIYELDETCYDIKGMPKTVALDLVRKKIH